MTDKELLELREEIAKLRERVAALEQRTLPLVQIGQRVPPLHELYPFKTAYTSTSKQEVKA